MHRVHLLRHACAGHKPDWNGEDRLRPLDPAGRTQADALAELLLEEPVRSLVSSPSRRCRDTLGPLSSAVHLPIVESASLAGTAPADEVLAMLTDPSNADSVMCTHGEVLARLLPRLRADGAEVVAHRRDDDWLLLKGSAWDLRVEHGAIVALHHCAPVVLHSCPHHPHPSSDAPQS